MLITFSFVERKQGNNLILRIEISRKQPLVRSRKRCV